MNLPHDALLQAGFSMPGGGELLLILLIVLVVFGHNRIPQLGDALGKGIRNFRKSFAKDETETTPTQREVQPLPENRAQPMDEKLAQGDKNRVV